MSNYKIAETDTFAKKIQLPKFRFLADKIRTFIYPILRDNPFYGPNIKKLKSEIKDLYRFRVGDYRLFYKVVEETIIVFVVAIEARKDAYK